MEPEMREMHLQHLRLEALKMALQGREGWKPNDVITEAKTYFAFIMGNEI